MKKQKRDLWPTVKFVWWILMLFVLTPAFMGVLGRAIAVAFRKLGR